MSWRAGALLPCLLALCLGWGCQPAEISAVGLEGQVLPLNGSLVVRFTRGRLLPASVTPASVRVMAGPLELGRRATVDDGELAIHVLVDEALMASLPQTVDVVLAGEPSLHALRFDRHRRLGATQRLSFQLDGRLAAQSNAFQLLTVAGLPVDAEAFPGGESLVLVFDGVLDPATLSPEACPLVRQQGSLSLQPALPEVSWSVSGQRSTLRLSGLPTGEQLHLRLRDWTLRDVAGRAPSPLVSLALDS